MEMVTPEVQLRLRRQVNMILQQIMATEMVIHVAQLHRHPLINMVHL